MDIRKVPETVRKDLEEMFGYERVDAFVRDSTPEEIFESWCKYNGLGGSWGSTLWKVALALQAEK